VIEGDAERPAFDRISPALQYHVVNVLGWRTLRPVQEQAVHAVMDGANCIVLAPTAGGKTEAALLPALSLIDSGDWPSPSVLYIAPIRALLNNLEPRLERLAGLVSRRSFVWHGDIGFSARQRALREGVDLIAITPESLEALLLSTRMSARQVLGQIRLVIVDEVHAFAGDDRGTHLVAILERVVRIAGRDLQRIGLSATVGNPAEISSWLSGSSEREQRVIQPAGKRIKAELAVDYVGNLENAARVIERLHPGRKRLVFADSRRRVEKLGHLLAARGVDVYVSHSSLAASERRAAESAFEQGTSCVIVATSALELGIDVGDLDHVLQIDATPTVSGFLQRMGRTGRRPGTVSNCTFLSTSDEALLQAVALLRLYEAGFVEPIQPDRRALHLLAHQLMALSLQLDGVARDRWWSWLKGAAGFAEVSERDREQLLGHMIAKGIIADVDHRLILGPEGERRYGRRRFQELYAVFSAPPELTVVHGPSEIGTIDRSFLEAHDQATLTFVLAGRPWQVSQIDWRRGICHVLPTEAGRYPAWPGQPRFLSRELCESVRQVLLDDRHEPWLSRRARKALDEIRDQHAFLRGAGSIVSHQDRTEWWTFAGGRANTLLSRLLQPDVGTSPRSGNFKVELRTADTASAYRAIERMADSARWDEEVINNAARIGNRARLSKLQPCLPEQQELALITNQVLDVVGAKEASESVGE
jgi:ATP-dependent Lhr-like helicase